MPPDTVVLAPAAHAAMVEAARAAWPREMVGLLGGLTSGTATTIERFVAIENGAARGDTFAVTPQAFLAAEHDLRTGGAAFVGFVHSHRDGVPAPSERDRRELWTDCLQLLVVAPPGSAPALGAFWLTGSAIVPIRLRGDARRVVR